MESTVIKIRSHTAMDMSTETNSFVLIKEKLTKDLGVEMFRVLKPSFTFAL